MVDLFSLLWFICLRWISHNKDFGEEIKFSPRPQLASSPKEKKKKYDLSSCGRNTWASLSLPPSSNSLGILFFLCRLRVCVRQTGVCVLFLLPPLYNSEPTSPNPKARVWLWSIAAKKEPPGKVRDSTTWGQKLPKQKKLWENLCLNGQKKIGSHLCQFFLDILPLPPEYYINCNTVPHSGKLIKLKKERS